MIASGLLPPQNNPEDDCPLTISHWKWPPREIAFRMICRLHNCPSENQPQGKLPPQENSLKDKLHPRYFFWTKQKTLSFNRQLLPLVFLLWVYKKKLYEHTETETAQKRRTSQEQIEYGIMKQICLCFPNRQRLTKFTVEKLVKFCSRKSKLSIYLNILQVGHFFHEILHDYFTFPVLKLVLQFFQRVPWYNL